MMSVAMSVVLGRMCLVGVAMGVVFGGVWLWLVVMSRDTGFGGRGGFRV